MRTPSTRNSTFVTPTLSEAFAERVTVAETVVPAVGEAMEAVGGSVSDEPKTAGERQTTTNPPTTPLS